MGSQATVDFSQIILYLLPVILLHVGLAVYCIMDIVRHGVKNLNKGGWIAIVVFIQIIGSILYLIVGRKGYDA